MIEIGGLTVRKQQRLICRIDEMSIPVGRRALVYGPNGSGKTTLLRVLAGLENQFDGRCEVSFPRRERVLVQQSPFLFRGTARSNLVYGIKAHGINGTRRHRRLEKWIDLLELASFVSAPVAHLSGGERRRVALARAMAIEPPLLLLDEPFAELDEAGGAAVRRAIADLSATTIVIASPALIDVGSDIENYRLSVNSTAMK